MTSTVASTSERTANERWLVNGTIPPLWIGPGGVWGCGRKPHAAFASSGMSLTHERPWDPLHEPPISAFPPPLRRTLGCRLRETSSRARSSGRLPLLGSAGNPSETRRHYICRLLLFVRREGGAISDIIRRNSGGPVPELGPGIPLVFEMNFYRATGLPNARFASAAPPGAVLKFNESNWSVPLSMARIYRAENSSGDGDIPREFPSGAARV